MDRLTKRINLGDGKFTIDFANDKIDKFSCNHPLGIRALFEKLADYEDLEEKLEAHVGVGFKGWLEHTTSMFE